MDQDRGYVDLLRTLVGAAAAILAALILFLTFGFRADRIEVMGSTRYTEEEITDRILEGMFSRNTLLSPMLLSGKDVSAIPYIESVRVTRQGNHTLRITVRERKPVGCFAYLDSFVYFDQSGIMVDAGRLRDEETTYFTGLSVQRVELKEKVSLKSSSILDTAVSIGTFFQNNGTFPDNVSFDENGQAILHFGALEARLGSDFLLEEKIQRILAVLPLVEGLAGTLHAESVTQANKRITFERIWSYEEWGGGYESDGSYSAQGQYDAEGNFVGPAPEGVRIPTIREVTGEAPDPSTGDMEAVQSSSANGTAAASLTGNTDGETGTVESPGNTGTDGSASPTGDGTQNPGTGYQETDPPDSQGSVTDGSAETDSDSRDYSYLLDTDGDGVNDYTGESMSETNLSDISFLDEDGDGLNDFTLQPLVIN